MMVRLDTDIEQQGLNLELLGLNDSQRDAYFSALTKQFSVIQGSYEMSITAYKLIRKALIYLNF